MPTIDVEAVLRIIREAAADEAMPRWRNLAAADVIEKAGPDDLVTVADRAVEAVLSRRLEALLPGSRAVGEEAVHTEPRLLGRLREPGATWVIDPIDGTGNFASGEPGFAVMVALVIDGAPVAGWLHAPALDQSTFAARGEGAWQQTTGAPERLPRPAPVTSLAQMSGMVGRRAFTAERRAAVLAGAAVFKALGPNTGCAGLDYPLLAAGVCHFALYGKSEPWDHLPGLAIVAEQGGHYARHDGSPYRPGDNTGGLLVAPSAGMWGPVRDALLA
jgi:fructose-1,6-bisphosphatase/inositol monophosphatase family enzyme